MQNTVGFEAAKIQETWKETSPAERWFNAVFVAIVFSFIIGVLSLLGLIREWSASVVQATDNSVPLQVPAVVTVGFVAIACLGLLAAAAASFWVNQKRVKKVLAKQALTVADRRLSNSLRKLWVRPAQARDVLIATYESKLKIAQLTAFCDVTIYNYSVIDTNHSGGALAQGLLTAPDERLIPLPPPIAKSGPLPEDLQRWLQISLPKLSMIKSVKTTPGAA